MIPKKAKDIQRQILPLKIINILVGLPVICVSLDKALDKT